MGTIKYLPLTRERLRKAWDAYPDPGVRVLLQEIARLQKVVLRAHVAFNLMDEPPPANQHNKIDKRIIDQIKGELRREPVVLERYPPAKD